MIESLIKLFDEFTRRGRIDDLYQLSREYGFDFQKRVSFGQQATELKSFRIFRQKGIKRLLGILSLESEQFNGHLRAYDFLRTKDLKMKDQTIIEIFCEDIFTDPVMIQPRSAFDIIKGFLVAEQRQFPKLTNFYQQYQISSPGQDDTLWLNEKALELMSKFQGLTLEAEGNYFLIYIRKKQMNAKEIMPILEFAEEFVRLTCFDRSADFV